MGTLKIHQENSYSSENTWQCAWYTVNTQKSVAFLHTMTLSSKAIRRIYIEHILSTLYKTHLPMDQGSQQGARNVEYDGMKKENILKLIDTRQDFLNTNSTNTENSN